MAGPLCLREYGNRGCRAIPTPFAVRLFEKEDDAPADVQTVVEPDISVICGKSKLEDHGCKGAPDMVIEILSPSTRRHDRLVKLNLYQRAGVKKYWIVSPSEQTVEVFLLKDGGPPRVLRKRRHCQSQCAGRVPH